MRGFGDCFRKKGDTDSALDWHHKALNTRLLRLGEHYLDVAKSYLRIGGCHQSKGQFTEAEKNIDEALAALNFSIANPPEFETVDALPVLLTALSQRADLYHHWYSIENEKAKLLEAQRNAHLAIQIVEHLRVQFFTEDSKRLLTKMNLPLFENALEINWKLYSLTSDISHLEEAFQVVEKSKGIILLHQVNKYRTFELCLFPPPSVFIKGLSGLTNQSAQKPKSCVFGICLHRFD